MSDEPRRLIVIATFEAANEMVIDDIAKLISEAEERQRQAAQIAGATEPDPPEEPKRLVRRLRIGGLAGGWFA